MRRLALALIVVPFLLTVAAAEEQAPKLLKPLDFAQLQILDLQAARAKEQFEKFGVMFRAELLRLQVQDGAVGCDLNEQQRAWVCPKVLPAETPTDKPPGR